jgi:phosphoenolpyruvate carboxykinase (ATP)
MVSAALNGSLDDVKYTPHPVFQILVPETVPGVPTEILNPRNAWEDAEAYDQQAQELARQFVENFKQFGSVRPEILEAGPIVR